MTTLLRNLRGALYLTAFFLVLAAFISILAHDAGYGGRYGEHTAVITTVLASTSAFTMLTLYLLEVTRKHPIVTHVLIGVICLVLLFGTSAGTMMSAFVFSLF